MTSTFSSAADTHTGLVRDNNEDCFLALPEQGIWLIADGMGGHECGEVASGIAKDTMNQLLQQGVSLSEAITSADQRIKTAAQANEQQSTMGTTIVACQIKGICYEIAWVGDSRAYLWSRGQLSRLSKDHSYVQALFDSGAISQEEMSNHAQKNVITRSLGGSPDSTLEVDTLTRYWHPGEKILLCSDGLSDLVTDDEISAILERSYETDPQLVDRLISTALKKGGFDNVTVSIISMPQKDSLTTRLHRQLYHLSRFFKN
jgi:protein phosphatase